MTVKKYSQKKLVSGFFMNHSPILSVLAYYVIRDFELKICRDRQYRPTLDSTGVNSNGDKGKAIEPKNVRKSNFY
jgi:hypothetical protein